MGKEESPSAPRRKTLRDAETLSCTINPSKPIAFYLDLSQRLLTSFEMAVEEQRLDDAYIFGIRFASFCLEALPQHPSYDKASMQAVHAKKVGAVVAAVEAVTAQMDAEELAKRRRQAKEREEHTWLSIFEDKDNQNRIRIKTTIRRTRIWVIGETGHGKTSAIGKLIDNPDVTGEPGWSHDTKTITEYQLNTIEPDREIQNLIFVDTRGTSDTGADVHYTAADLFIDMKTYKSHAEESKVVFVIRYGRLQPGPLKMISDLYQAFQNDFMVLITGTMGQNGHAELTLRDKLRDEDIGFTGSILCVDWEDRSEDSVRQQRSIILDTISTMSQVDVRRLSFRGFFGSSSWKN